AGGEAAAFSLACCGIRPRHRRAAGRPGQIARTPCLAACRLVTALLRPSRTMRTRPVGKSLRSDQGFTHMSNTAEEGLTRRDLTRRAVSTARQPWRMGFLPSADVAAVAGAMLLFGACAYRRIWHPLWSGGEALAALWPFYAIGGGAIFVRWLLGRRATE